MHRNGVWHNDLNVKNILVRAEGDKPAVYVIDFDRGRLFEGAVPERAAEGNLARLHRSVRKLDPEHKHISDDDWSELLDGYHGTGC
jgi:tRNA A-37 threonylcarbamoyl transferase component Bud32